MRAIRCANAYSNTDRDPQRNVYAYADAYADPMHGEMCTDTATAPYASTTAHSLEPRAKR